jgi:homoserine dehydrogenase
MFYGRGAGMMPTASAVVADIIDVALGNSGTTFRHLHLKPRHEVAPPIEPIDDTMSRYYIRVMAKDEPGVVARYGKALGDNQISIRGALQHEGTGPDNTVPVVITTHPTRQRNINAALRELEKLDVLSGKPVCIRIVDIPEDKES